MYPEGSEAKMADVEFSHGMGAHGRDPEDFSQQEEFQIPPRTPLTVMTNVAGAVVSLALIAGIGVWGYKLMLRDVSGIPVVKAAEGEMRVRPDDPGGELARHQGLAVNMIAANGEAEGPVDRVTLAPRDVGLSQDDQPIALAEPEPVIQPAPLGPAEEAFADGPKFVQAVVTDPEGANLDEMPAQEDGFTGDPAIDAIIAELTGHSLAGATDADDAEEDTVEIVQGPGVKQSMRPRIRPATRPAVATNASFEVPAETSEIDPAAIPEGTRLAQLGAFESVDVARLEWTRLEQRFGEYLTGKSRVIELAETGGSSFYRLRAMGFVDLADARRFCSAFKAEGVDCIPVASK